MLTASLLLLFVLKPHIFSRCSCGQLVWTLFIVAWTQTQRLCFTRLRGGKKSTTATVTRYSSSLFILASLKVAFALIGGCLCRLKEFFQIFLEVLLRARCWRNLWALSSGWVRAAINHLVVAAASACLVFFLFIYQCSASPLNLCRSGCTASTPCCPRSTSVGAACWSNGSTSQFSRLAGRTEPR